MPCNKPQSPYPPQQSQNSGKTHERNLPPPADTWRHRHCRHQNRCSLTGRHPLDPARPPAYLLHPGVTGIRLCHPQGHPANDRRGRYSPAGFRRIGLSWYEPMDYSGAGLPAPVFKTPISIASTSWPTSTAPCG